MIKKFDSISDLISEAKSLGITQNSGISDSSWYNNESLVQTLKYAINGNDSLVPKAQSLIDSLDTEIETPRREWIPNVAGAYPVVADYCRGLPCSMRRRVELPNDSAPINILVCTTSSAGIDSAYLQKRGTVILALVLALSAIRPVSLHVFAMLDGHVDATGEIITMAKINTTPLDLSIACYCLTSSGFDRRIFHFISRKLANYQGGWPRDYTYDSVKQNKYLADLPLRLGFEPKDTLLIKPAYIGDTMLQNPISWINQQIQNFRQDSD